MTEETHITITRVPEGVHQHVDGSWAFVNETYDDDRIGYETHVGYRSVADAARAQRGCADVNDARDTDDARFFRENPGRVDSRRDVGMRATHRAISLGAELWIGRRTPVLDAGCVELLDYMGGDSDIVQAARTTTDTTGRTPAEDEALLRYMLRHRHTTPFEMVQARFLLCMPIFVARQWVRHRMATLNEYSMRYSEPPDAVYIPAPDLVARQSTSNRQGRGEAVDGDELLQVLDHFTDNAHDAMTHYRRLRDDHDVARELARAVLPVGTYTTFVWRIDLHNLMHFLTLRLDPHAQVELRAFAQQLARVVADWVPWAWRAFVDYRLEARTFSRVELVALASVLARRDDTRPIVEAAAEAAVGLGLKGRELDEFKAKIQHVAGLEVVS